MDSLTASAVKTDEQLIAMCASYHKQWSYPPVPTARGTALNELSINLEISKHFG